MHRCSLRQDLSELGISSNRAYGSILKGVVTP